ncbi:MAG: hypothetical protein JRF63_05600, partial [Deltaproteobacteria bacterium]|nr:hypothetical protein [Deltaproteobacteria bacterium]
SDTDTSTFDEVLIELTPTDGSLANNHPYWAMRGYRIVPSYYMQLLAYEWFFTMPTTASTSARLYTGTGTLLASGTTVFGDGTEQWYRSDISYSLSSGTTYVLAFYTTSVTTCNMDYKSGPSQPFTVPGHFTNTRSLSNTSATTEQFPTSDNSWAPYHRVVIAD